jgi:hypothetical protein
MKLRDIIALIAMFVIAVVGKGFGIWGDGGDGPSPRRPIPQDQRPDIRGQLPPGWKDKAGSSEVRPLVPAPVPSEIHVRVPKKGPSSGTAFSVDAGGHWLTARHVVDGCSDVLIVVGTRRAIRVARVFSHPNADLSILATGRGAPPLAVMRSLGRVRDGFQFGFPQGKPGAVYSTFIGATRLRSHGRYNTLEPVYAWAERIRVPSYQGSLGGLSGGPLVDRTGAVIGVIQAEAPRRGRIFSAAPASLLAAFDMAALSVATVAGGRPARDDLNRTDFPRHGKTLMQRLSVAKVVCRV